MATLNLWYNFSKRRNSTKAPSGAADHSVDAKLKEETSLANPVFIVVGDLFAANYAQFAGMYYYVDDVVSIHNGLCEVHCSKDVLATYKSNIQATSAMVLYYNHANTEIADKRLSTKTTKVVSSNYGVFDGLGTVNPVNPVVILMVNGVNSVGAYAINQSVIATLLNAVNSTVDSSITQLDFNDLTLAVDTIDWLTRLGRILGDWFTYAIGRVIYSGGALENIRSAHILPLSMSDIANDSHKIFLGNFDTNIYGNRITDPIFSDSASVTIPWPTGINDWRRNAPYTELYLYIPYIGLTSLSVSDLIGETTITVNMSLDKFSGDAIFQVKTGSGNCIGHYTTNLKADYPIGSSNVTSAKATAGMISSAVGAATAVAGVATGGPGALIVGGAATAGLGLVNMVSPTPMSIGGATGGAMLGITADKSKVTCYSVFHDTTINNPNSIASVIGTPCNEVLSLSGISGFVQTANASVDLPGFGTDKDIVNSYLNGGIYIE